MQTLNAMYFNLPQSKERMIFVGIREDLGIEPSHPRAEGRPFTVEEAWREVKIESKPYLSPKLAGIISRIPIYGDGGDVCNAFFSTKRLSFDHPSRTILKGNVGSRACFVHPSEDRAITIAEMKRIMSFPDEFIFIGGYKKEVERLDYLDTGVDTVYKFIDKIDSTYIK